MNFLKFLRPNKNPFNSSALVNTIRGAKRKGEKKQEGVLTEHILNPFKNAEDVAILPDNYYPPWVKRLAQEPMVMEEMFGNSIAGVGLPNHGDQFTIAKKIRRFNKFKIKNRVKHSHALFEKKWEMEPEGDENQLDVEWGVLPQVIEDYAKDEMKKLDASEGGSSGGGGGGAPEKKTE